MDAAFERSLTLTRGHHKDDDKRDDCRALREPKRAVETASAVSKHDPGQPKRERHHVNEQHGASLREAQPHKTMREVIGRAMLDNLANSPCFTLEDPCDQNIGEVEHR